MEHSSLLLLSFLPISVWVHQSPSADATSLVCLVQEPDPNQPKPEGQQMTPLDGENLMVNKWPPSLPAALQRWGTSQPKSPCLTALDNGGKPVYTLTYGRRSLALQKTGPKFAVTEVIMTLFCCPFLFCLCVYFVLCCHTHNNVCWTVQVNCGLAVRNWHTLFFTSWAPEMSLCSSLETE